MKNEKLAKRVSSMGTDKKIRNNESYLTGFVKVQVAYGEDAFRDYARAYRWEEALMSMAKFVMKHAIIEGVNVVSSVDIVNRNGTGVACLDCENSEYVTESLDQMECVESYSVR
jgi:hypothetical protein